MPAKTEKQRKFMGAELQRKREGKQTKTDMSEKELEKMASKEEEKKKHCARRGPVRGHLVFPLGVLGRSAIRRGRASPPVRLGPG